MSILRRIREQRIVDRAYTNGYEQGRFDERMERELAHEYDEAGRPLLRRPPGHEDIPGRIATSQALPADTELTP